MKYSDFHLIVKATVCVNRNETHTVIAETLYLSEGTVRNHISAILAKLDVADRTQAVVMALKHGIK